MLLILIILIAVEAFLGQCQIK